MDSQEIVRCHRNKNRGIKSLNARKRINYPGELTQKNSQKRGRHRWPVFRATVEFISREGANKRKKPEFWEGMEKGNRY